MALRCRRINTTAYGPHSCRAGHSKAEGRDVKQGIALARWTTSKAIECAHRVRCRSACTALSNSNSNIGRDQRCREGRDHQHRTDARFALERGAERYSDTPATRFSGETSTRSSCRAGSPGVWQAFSPFQATDETIALHKTIELIAVRKSVRSSIELSLAPARSMTAVRVGLSAITERKRAEEICGKAKRSFAVSSTPP